MTDYLKNSSLRPVVQNINALKQIESDLITPFSPNEKKSHDLGEQKRINKKRASTSQYLTVSQGKSSALFSTTVDHYEQDSRQRRGSNIKRTTSISRANTGRELSPV